MNLEERFDTAMMDIYRRAKSEAKYSATRYFQMLTDHRGLETARLLLHSNSVSEGYTALWERGRLDLTVEALIHDHLDDFVDVTNRVLLGLAPRRGAKILERRAIGDERIVIRLNYDLEQVCLHASEV